jgi:hypothetical protein
MNRSRDEAARELAFSHGQAEEAVSKVIRLLSDREGDASEPIKLLEINANTFPAGIIPVIFGDSADFPFASVIVEVTPDEFQSIRSGKLPLPEGWEMGETLFEREKTAA